MTYVTKIKEKINKIVLHIQDSEYREMYIFAGLSAFGMPIGAYWGKYILVTFLGIQ